MPSRSLKVLQLIDSLEIGGAERVAVNLANALAEQGVQSHLCATRFGGPLESFLLQDVKILILNKKQTIDFSALYRLVTYIRSNGIEVLHAHSSSFFIANLVRFFCRVEIVWHDHNGILHSRPKWIYRLFSLQWAFVISVNQQLALWSQQNLWLHTSRVRYLPNFADLGAMNTDLTPNLPGKTDQRIVCLANLRYPKDHLTLINAFQKVHQQIPQAHLFLIGKDSQDDYSEQLKSQIQAYNLKHQVHVLGSRNDVAAILQQCAVGVLSSEFEGLPVALLEYGLAGLPVVCTRVGECAEVLDQGNAGILVPPKDADALAHAIISLLSNQEKAKALGNQLLARINQFYSKDAVIKQLLVCYHYILETKTNE
jgi:glycosyltransferase involved in cell wall biosynthesis